VSNVRRWRQLAVCVVRDATGDSQRRPHRPALISQSASWPLPAVRCGSRMIISKPCSARRQRCQPIGPSSIAFPAPAHNLAADFKLKGLRSVFRARVPLRAWVGAAFDLIRLGRRQIVFAVGAEELQQVQHPAFATFARSGPKPIPGQPLRFRCEARRFVGTGGARSCLFLKSLNTPTPGRSHLRRK